MRLPGRTASRHDDANRGRIIGDALTLIEWLESRHIPFGAIELAEVMGWKDRTSYRWLESLEGHGLIEKAGYGKWEAKR